MVVITARAPESSGSVDPSTLPAGVAVGTKVGMVLGVRESLHPCLCQDLVD